MTRLEVLICTHGRDGIERVGNMQLPRVDGVRYLVSWQQSGEGAVPGALCRDDIRVVTNGTTGLSNNRNEAFAASTGELLLIADDDLEYTPEGLQAVIDIFDRHGDVLLATFKSEGGDGKVFPDREFDLEVSSRPKNYFITSFEIAMRRVIVAPDGGGLRFDPRFGIGSELFGSGEEDLFVLDAIDAGYRCRYFPVTIVSHPGLTTAYRHLTPAVLRSIGALTGRMYPWYSAWARFPLIAWRHYKRHRYTLLPAMWHLYSGWLNFKRL